MSQVVSKVVDKVATKKSLKGGPKLWAEVVREKKTIPKNPQKIFPAIQKKTKMSISKSWRKTKTTKEPPDFSGCFRDDPPCNLFPIPHDMATSAR